MDMFISYNIDKQVIEKGSKMKSYQKALFIIVAVCTLGCSDYQAQNLYDEGITLREAGNELAAESKFLEAVELKEDFAEAYYELGSIKFKKKQFSTAIKFYDKAILFDSTYAIAYYDMGSAYSNLKLRDKAIQLYKKSMVFGDSTNNSLALIVIGELYIISQEYDLAEESFIEAINYGLSLELSLSAHIHLGDLYFLNKIDFKKALKEYKTVLPSYPNNEQLKKNILNCEKYLSDPAYLKLTTAEYNYIKYVFDNAPTNFQSMINLKVMPYGKFLRLNLDNQIKKCKSIRKEWNMNDFTFALALQEWLRIDSKTAYTIIEY